MTNAPLDNIVWNSLTGRQSSFTIGTSSVRRFAPGLSPITAFADANQPDLDALAPFCEPGEQLYCEGWSGRPPGGWRIIAESTMLRMVWQGVSQVAADEPEAVRLGPMHSAQALSLATLSGSGPFGPRTLELGEYFGLFEGERLIAMAGERLFDGAFREISGVCTHPDFQGRGFARHLMTKLIFRQLKRGETPFLHVMGNNTTAQGLYSRMGFRDYCESVIRVIALV